MVLTRVSGPETNGQCEHFNRTLLEMLGTLEPRQKSDWRSYVAPLMHIYNCTKQETTQFSPYFLLFGREPRMAIDLLLPPYSADPVVGDRIRKAVEASKAWYSKKVRGATLHPGDQVLVRQVGF